MPVTQYDIAPMQGASLWGYLEQSKTMRLATVRGNSAIELCPVWFVVRRERVCFAIDPVVGDPGRALTPASRLLPALDAGARVSGVVDDGEDLSAFRGVQLSGTAALIGNARMRNELLDLALEKYFYVGHPHLEHYLSKGMVDARRWYELVHDQAQGWDRRLLPQPPIMEHRILPPHLR